MTEKSSILVVDDEQDFLDIIKRILQRKGYAVETAASASEAVARAQARFYQVAVLDISLPDTRGTELLSMLLARHPDMIAIMLTGHSSVQNATESLNRGAFAYLEKPLDPEQLLAVINRGLEKQRLVLENRQLIDKLAQHDRETSILLGVSQAVAQSLDQERIVGAALEKVARTLDVEAACVHLVDNGRLRLKGYCGFTPPTAAGLEAAADGLMSQILQQGESVIRDGLAGATESDLVVLAGAGYHAYAGAPLTVVGESVGVIGIATCAERCFTPAEVSLLAAMGREIAIAVRNSQLYEEASSARALRELDTLRTEFLANVSHELRTPLAVIKGSASSLLQSDVNFDEDTWRDFLQSIDSDADKLTRLVNDLLMMSRLESGALEVRKERQSLAGVIESVKIRLGKLAAQHQLAIDVPPGLPDVLADEERIGEVLTNLVENAVKHSPEGTRIMLTATPNSRDVIVSVADEGIGIPAELHQKIFDRFYQVNDHKQKRRTGTGLGLAICRGIVEAHGGRIWVESEPEKGARFRFSLPTE